MKGANSRKPRPKSEGKLGEKRSVPGHSDWTGPTAGHAHEAHGRHFAFSAEVVPSSASLDGPLSLFFCMAVTTEVSVRKPVPLSCRLKFSLPIFSPHSVGNTSFTLFLYVKPLQSELSYVSISTPINIVVLF